MSTDPTKKKDDHVSTSKALDDEQRVKVLSPGMLVAKRFFRNKLAVAGLIILVAMFLFSFIGGMVSPYNESQVFRKTDHVWKDYAGATYNKSYIFTGTVFSTNLDRDEPYVQIQKENGIVSPIVYLSKEESIKLNGYKYNDPIAICGTITKINSFINPVQIENGTLKN